MKFISRFFSFLLLFFVLSATPLMAQTSLKAANRHYDLTEYARAIQIYKRLLKENGPSVKVLEGLGNSYFKMNNTREAAGHYDQAYILPKFSNTALFRYALAVQRNENYEKAKELFLRYGEREKDRIDLVNKYIAACDMAIAIKAEPVALEATKAPFNSENSDFSPVFHKNRLLFSSDRPRATKNPAGNYAWTGKSFLQLYTVEKDSATGQWSAPVVLPNKINTMYHNATAAYPGNGDVLYFTRTNKEKVRRKNGNPDPTSWEPIPAKDIFVNRLEIFSSEFKNGAWTEAKPFAHNNYKNYSVGHPAFSPDGNTMYFVSDMPGGFGETDLYFSALQPDGTWAKPVNCGAGVNTSGKETFPTMAPNGTLYFSSDGHMGMGGLDLFSAEGGRDQWSAITNLKTPFNSGGDDFGIIFEPGTANQNGYFSSNRNSETGTDDIYSFGLPKPKPQPCRLEGLVFEQPTIDKQNEPLKPIVNAKIMLYRGADTAAVVAYSDEAGKFFFDLEGGPAYTVKVFKEGFLTKSAAVPADCKVSLGLISSELTAKNKRNTSYKVENIYYDLDKYEIRPDAAAELNKLVAMLEDNPTIRIELSSHTDSRAAKGYNRLLSQLRADAAVRYITDQGINPRRLKAKGYGETQLLNRCKDDVNCTEEEHQQNRRTEFKLIR